MVGFVVKNGHQKDMFYDEIGVCEQNIDTILHSLVNITIGRVYVITLKRKRKGHKGFGMVGFKAVWTSYRKVIRVLGCLGTEHSDFQVERRPRYWIFGFKAVSRNHVYDCKNTYIFDCGLGW
jgi:hypothetical protein